MRWVLLLLAVLLAACGGGAGVATAPDGSATDAPAPADGATTDDGATDAGLPEALAFTATTVGGGTFDGADHVGQDLMLWFWAPW